MTKQKCIILVGMLTTLTSSLNVNVDQSGLWLIPEDTNMTLNLGLVFNFSDPRDMELLNSDSSVVVKILPDEDWKLDFVNNTVEFTVNEVRDGRNKSIVLSGYYWGRTQLSFYLVDPIRVHSGRSDINGTLLRDDITVGVNRAFSLVDNIFMSAGTLFIFINTISMGCELNLQVIYECLRKPLGPLCGFISQFGFMPPFSYAIGYYLFDDALFRLGLFTLGCSPGGLISNFWTLMFNGDINLSITMTFVSTVAALGMMPLWVFTLGKTIVGNDENLQIPFGNLVISLITLTVPIAIGIIIKLKRPNWAAKLSKIIKPFTLVVLIFFFTVGIYNSYKLFVLMTPRMYLAGFIVAFAGFLFGALFALCWCLRKERVIAISIETALQNTATAYIVLKLSLPSPDGDMASLPLMAQAIQTGLGLLVFYFGYITIRKLCWPHLQRVNSKPDRKTSFMKENLELAKSLVRDEEAFRPQVVSAREFQEAQRGS